MLKSHTNSEERDIYLGLDLKITVLDISPLHKQEQSLAAGKERQKQESEHMLYSGICSIRNQTQVGRYLKYYWLKEQNVLPQHLDKDTNLQYTKKDYFTTEHTALYYIIRDLFRRTY